MPVRIVPFDEFEREVAPIVAGPPSRLRIIGAPALLKKKLPPAEFVLPGILPVGLTLLAGRPKLGKSFLALSIALSVASGKEALGKPTGEPGDALFLALEDGERRVQDRLVRMLAGEPAPARLAIATECPALDSGGEDALRDWLSRSSRPRLVVVDVFQRVRPKGDRSGRMYADDYASVLPLKRLADEFGIAIVAVTHTRKGEADHDPLDAVSATTGLAGAADAVLILDRAGDGVTLYGRGRDLEETSLALRFDPTRCLWGVMGDRAEVSRSPTRNAILKALEAATAPLTPSEIAAQTGIAANTIKQRLLGMVAAGEIVKAARGAYAPARPSTPHNLHNHRNEGEREGYEGNGSDGGESREAGP